MSTINSHLNAIEAESGNNDEFIEKAPNFNELFSIVVDKIQNISNPIHFIEDHKGNSDQINQISMKNKELEDEIQGMKEKMEQKGKEKEFLGKQKDNLREQLDSAVKIVNDKDLEFSKNKIPEFAIFPSLQTQIQALQDESRNEEVTMDTTEQIIESFEKNNRILKDKLDSAVVKIKNYKEKNSHQKTVIKTLEKGNPELKINADERVKLTVEIKTKIREEEIYKRDKEIERQRKITAQKSEEQSIMFGQKIEELEAKLEAKDDELTDLLIKLQETEQETEKLRKSNNIKSTLSIDDQLDQLTSNPSKSRKFTNYDTQLKVLKKVEKLNEKINEFGEKIGELKIEIMEHLKAELNQKNPETEAENQSSKLTQMNEREIYKLQKMKDSKSIIQVVRKLETEGMNWLLLEKKDHLDRPLEIKSSNSMSKSSIENTHGGRKLWWVCEEYLKQDLLDYIFQNTPPFLLESASIKINLPELFTDEYEKNTVQLLKESVNELYGKRQELLRDQRDIMLGLRRENFLLGKYILIINI